MNTMNTKIRKCGLCNEPGHNKSTCPHREIDDTFVRAKPEVAHRPEVRDTQPEVRDKQEVIEETIEISDKRERLIHDLLECESYDIDSGLFMVWLQLKKPITLKEMRYTIDKGLRKPSVILYMKIVEAIDDYY